MADNKKRKRTKKSPQDMRELGANTVGVASGILFSKILTIIIGGIALILVARFLGSSSYGLYGLAVSTVGILISLGGLGISTALPKFVGEYKAKGEKSKLEGAISSGLATVIISGLILTGIAILFSGFISQLVFKSSSYWILIVAAALTITLSMLLDASYSTLVGLGRKGMLVKVTALQITSQAVISISLAFLGFGAIAPIIGIVVGFASGSALAIVSIYTESGIKLRMPDEESMKTILKFALPVGLYSAIGGIIGNLGNIILGQVSTTAIVGSFVFASRIGGVMNLAADSVGAALLPLLASINGKKQSAYSEKFYSYAIYIMLVILMPVSFSVSILARNISLLVGGTFSAATYYIPIVAIGVIITTLSYYTSIMLLSKNRVIDVLKYSALSSIIELVLFVIFVPIFKGVGLSVIVFIITPMVSFIAYYSLVRKMLELKLAYKKIARALVAALISSATLIPVIIIFYNSSIFTLIFAMAELLIVYPPIVSILGGINRSDLVTIKDISSGIPIVGQALSILSSYAMHYVK